MLRWNVKRMVIDGPKLERWFLKTLINLSLAGDNSLGNPARELVKIAFGSSEFGHGAGMYLVGRAGEQIDSYDRLSCITLTDEHGNPVGGRFNFRGYTFLLYLLPEKLERLEESHLLYRHAILKCRVQNRLSHEIEITGW